MRLPKLKLGTHKITITARTGSGSSARSHRVIRSFEVVASRLTRTTTSYVQPSGTIQVRGRLRPHARSSCPTRAPARSCRCLLELASGGSARLERALAADVATSLIVERFGAGHVDPDLGFDGTAYQRGDGGIAILPYASSDLEVSALAALVAPDRFNGRTAQGTT